MTFDRDAHTLEVACRVAEILRDGGLETAVIGAIALAAHGYSRATSDIDLGTATSTLRDLDRARAALEAAGFAVVQREPDYTDALGGTLTVTGADFDPIQIVNFLNPHRPRPSPGAEGIRSAAAGLLADPRLRVIDLPHLVASKLATEARKDEADVVELLARNPAADPGEIRAVCERFGLAARFDALAAEVLGLRR